MNNGSVKRQTVKFQALPAKLDASFDLFMKLLKRAALQEACMHAKGNTGIIQIMGSTKELHYSKA